MTDNKHEIPISGEIMAGMSNSAGRSPHGSAPASFREVLDADYETVSDSLVLRQTGTAVRSGGLRTTVDSRQHQRKFGSSSNNLAFWLICIAAVAGAFWLSGGHVLFRADASANVDHLHKKRITEVSVKVLDVQA